MRKKAASFRLCPVRCLLTVPVILVLAGCQGISSASKQASSNNAGANQLAVTPSAMNFGNVAVGSNVVKPGSLTAGSSDITVTSAAWNGQGYSLSGITFPVTVPATQSVQFKVTFAPQASGSTPGSIAFDSNATNSPAMETLSGNGTQGSIHNVALSWNPSTSLVIGYNVYRGTTSGGPYTKVNPALDPNTDYTDSSVQSGQTYYYVTTGVDSQYVESAHSNQATAVIPTP